MPRGVSHSAMTPNPARPVNWAADSALGSITVRSPLSRRASRSARCSGLSTGLILTTSRELSVTLRAARPSSPRAAALRAGSTLSSRSMTTLIAAAAALANRSGRSAGQNSQSGPGGTAATGSGTGVMAHVYYPAVYYPAVYYPSVTTRLLLPVRAIAVG